MNDDVAVVSARLSRGSGPGQWQAYRSTAGESISVFVHCPFCGALGSLGDIPVANSGQVGGSLQCAYCSVLYRLFLEAWTFDDVDRPSVFAGAISQADGFES